MALEGEFHTPSMGHEFFPGGDKAPTEDVPGREGLWFYDFANGFFALDRLMIIRLLMILVLVAFFVIAMRKPKLVPRGIQNLGEYLLDFVRIHIAEDILGKKEGRRFLPVIATIFFVVLVGNIPSVIPFLNVSPNARIGMPILALGETLRNGITDGMFPTRTTKKMVAMTGRNRRPSFFPRMSSAMWIRTKSRRYSPRFWIPRGTSLGLRIAITKNATRTRIISRRMIIRRSSAKKPFAKS